MPRGQAIRVSTRKISSTESKPTWPILLLSLPLSKDDLVLLVLYPFRPQAHLVPPCWRSLPRYRQFLRPLGVTPQVSCHPRGSGWPLPSCCSRDSISGTIRKRRRRTNSFYESISQVRNMIVVLTKDKRSCEGWPCVHWARHRVRRYASAS